MAKNDLVFLLLEEKLIHRGFILEPTKKKTKFSLKTLMEIFTIGTLPFKRLACSCRTITGDFERFHFFNLETFLEK